MLVYVEVLGLSEKGYLFKYLPRKGTVVLNTLVLGVVPIHVISSTHGFWSSLHIDVSIRSFVRLS